MATRLYLMPLVGTGTRADPRRPKYRDSIFPSPIGYGMFDYGSEPWCMVGIIDLAPAAHTVLVANADVTALPQNIDVAIGAGGALTVARNGLESVNIPGTWIQSTTTYREAVRFVGAVCQFAQRFQGQTGGLWFGGGVTLATTFGALPAAAQQGLLDAANSFGFDTSGLISASTLRQILVSVGNQYLATQPPLQLAGLQL